MLYDNIVLVATEPVPEMKPSSEQLQRLARGLYPIIAEYYALEQEDKQEGADAPHSGNETVR